MYNKHKKHELTQLGGWGGVWEEEEDHHHHHHHLPHSLDFLDGGAQDGGELEGVVACSAGEVRVEGVVVACHASEVREPRNKNN